MRSSRYEVQSFGAFSEIGAAEFPVFGLFTQPRLDGVFFNIPYDCTKVFAVANVSVEIFFVPEVTLPIEQLVRFVRGVRLQRMHDIGNGVAGKRLDEDMDVIRHYHPCDQAIFLAVQVQYRVLDKIRDPLVG